MRGISLFNADLGVWDWESEVSHPSMQAVKHMQRRWNLDSVHSELRHWQ